MENSGTILDGRGPSSILGGGVFINFARDKFECPSGNILTINNSRFVSNVADIGGGIATEANCLLPATPPNKPNKLQIENCVFDNNYADYEPIFYHNNFIDYMTMNSTIIPWHGV